MSLPFTRTNARTVSLCLDDDILDGVDLVRMTIEGTPSRSAVVRDLLGFALGVMLDDEIAETWIAARAETKRLLEEAPAGNA